jgi:hypothetical protein
LEYGLQKSKAIAALAASVIVWADPASAEREAEPPPCTAFSVADSTPLAGVKLVSAGHIAPGGLVHTVFQPGQACIAERGNPKYCASDVKAGTSGVLLRHFKSWACVVLPGKGKIATQAVWIPQSRWAVDKPVTPGAWVGIWQNEGAKITVTSSEGHLHFVGNAIWQGRTTPHFGSFEFDAVPEGDLVTLVDECEVRIRRLGEFLFAQENQKCGAMNVSFDGLYRFRADLKP